MRRNLITIPDFAKKYQIPLHTLYYYVKFKCKIKPKIVTGKMFLFNEDELVECLNAEFRRIGRKYREPLKRKI